MARGAEHGLDGVGVEAAGAHLAAQLVLRRRRGDRAARCGRGSRMA